MSQKRKSPIRHRVETFLREGKRVRAFVRGNGVRVPKRTQQTQNPSYLGSVPTLDVERIGTIGDADLDGFVLQTDSQDVEAIKERLGNPKELSGFEGFFVKIKNGEYPDVLAFGGTVPANGKSLYRISRDEPKHINDEEFAGKAREGKLFAPDKADDAEAEGKIQSIRRHAKSGAKAGFEFAKRASKVGAESIRETASEAVSKVEQSNLRNLIDTALYSPSQAKRSLAQSTLKNFYTEIYETLKFPKPDRKQVLLDIAKRAAIERDKLLENEPDGDET